MLVARQVAFGVVGGGLVVDAGELVGSVVGAVFGHSVLGGADPMLPEIDSTEEERQTPHNLSGAKIIAVVVEVPGLAGVACGVGSVPVRDTVSCIVLGAEAVVS